MTSNLEDDHVLPEGRWEFNDEVASVFDNMLRRSIPQHDEMRRVVDVIARSFLEQWDDGTIIDLGCSRGEALAPLVDTFGDDFDYLGIEVAEPMLEAARRRFENDGTVDIRSMDLRTDYPEVEARVTLAVLTLQFIPIEYRQMVLKRIHDHTASGGCFILVEKVLGSTAFLNDAMVRVYTDMKRRNGYSQEEIDRKRFSLEGVLVPVTESWNREMLHAAGFQQVECVWRWMNFAAWVAVRE